MKNSNSKGFRILKKIYQDLRRGNDPTVGWGAPKQYLATLIWIRTILGFGAATGAALGLAAIYIQLQQAPIQKFLRACQQETASEVCVDRWNKLRSNS
jgi:hypothetical protein